MLTAMQVDNDAAFLQTLSADLKAKVKKAISKHPDLGELFEEVIEFFQENSNRNGLVHKKPKVEAGDVLQDIGEMLVQFSELSFQAPIRKKALLQLHESGLALSVLGSIEFSLLYTDIERILCLPSPNKGKAHFTWVIIPTDDGEDCTLPVNTVVFSFDDQAKLSIEAKLELDADAHQGGNNDLIFAAVSTITADIVEISTPDPSVFISSDTTGYNQKPVPYINCYDRAKEGFMYFFEFGLFFGYKKPLMFYPSEDIKKLEITSITGRFFNLHIILNGMEKGDFMEYSMFAAAELKGVQEYIYKFFRPAKKDKASISSEPSQNPAGPSTIMNANLESDEADEDFILNEHSDEDVEDDDDSDEEDDASSVEIGSGEEEGENEESDDQDVVVFESSKKQDSPSSKASHSQLKAIEEQRSHRLMQQKGARLAVTTEVDDNEEEDLGESSDADSRLEEEEDYETGSEEDNEDESGSPAEEPVTILVEASGQTTEMEDELA